GIDDSDNQFPDCVAVGSGNQSFDFRGTGTLIAPNVVLTANHCFENGLKEFVFVGNNVFEINKGRIYKVSRAIPYQPYDKNDHFNDICLLILEEDVKDVTPRKIATLAQVEAVSSGSSSAHTLMIVGFGSNVADGTNGLGKRRKHLVAFNSSCGADAQRFKCN